MTKCTAPVDPNSIVIPKKPPNKSASEHRKITKPIMEKRRRARINQSLEQLKQILVEQFHECSKKSNNLEKADILELTVKHLREITNKQQQNQIKQQQLINQQQQQQLMNTQPAHQHHNNNKSTTNVALNKNLLNRMNLNNQLNSQMSVGKKDVQLIKDGFNDCKQQIDQYLSQVDKQLNRRLNNHLTKFERQQFEQRKFNCDQVLNLSIHDQLLSNNSQASNLLLHTPSSACSSSSSNVFFPHNLTNGSLSPGSERSLSPSSNDGSVWRPW